LVGNLPAPSVPSATTGVLLLTRLGRILARDVRRLQ
jgi:hypothetical protein